ncbi:4-alpha-glucanotransferase [Bosea sp. UNC402CLCol]|uniref:4-alpha-glucanotransferase n=1 Tax=Bosea sp. UNC402CLCol TaxID=1510531 RepID=UPI00068A0013|nr:4-alpha-glucanotransferase [Bosea sp. UNC402CLCol]
MSDDILRQLATRAGIAPEWTDQTGAQRQVSPESLRAILAALGLPADNDEALRNSLSLAEGGSMGLGSRFTTARIGQPVGLPLRGEPGQSVEVTLESGARRVVTTIEGYEGALTLPPFDEPGYHTVHAAEGDFTVATAPERCITFADLNDGRPGWGLAAQIYSLRSEADGGIGHFGGVAALGRAAAARGADALAISPVHALYGALPALFSPYSPSTRLFYNPLHADPAAALPDALIRDVIARQGLAEEMARLSALAQINWLSATPARQRLLRALFDALRDPAASGTEAARADFERHLAEASPLLRGHAIFEALHAIELTRDPTVKSWREWQPAYRHPDNPEVAAFAAEHADEIAYQIFLQWLTGRSYGEAQRACREAGMKVGLIADLAIGMDGAGSHAWSRPDDILHGLSIGAPPDYYAAEGQNWALTTFSPRGLAATGYAPFIETLRASLRYVGGIRIDHVMGMSRLWLVPEGASALEGAYVGFPSETLFRLIALESWRHRAIVIGEDLGTLPYGFRDYLSEQGVAGLRVLRFERTDHGYVPPQEWDAGAVALTSTHDLVPTAGWWAGSDIDPVDDGVDHQGIRAWDRGLLWGSFQNAGLVEGERPEPDNTDPVVDAAIRYVAATPCTLKILPMEDALGIRTQPNVPGTITEKPNWRHRLEGDADALLDDAKVRKRLAYLGPERGDA